VKIVIAAAGAVDAGIMQALTSELERTFGCAVEVRSPIEVPAKYYDKKRQQYNVSSLLSSLGKIKLDKGDRILAVTEVDLFALGLNFVFGQAELGGPASIISLARLRPEMDPALFLERAVKEAVHELGHTFGLGHCPDPKCVMHFSNNLHDTDIKSKTFCPNCQPKMIA
jgi:archaemetzincin